MAIDDDATRDAKTGPNYVPRTHPHDVPTVILSLFVYAWHGYHNRTLKSEHNGIYATKNSQRLLILLLRFRQQGSTEINVMYSIDLAWILHAAGRIH